MTVTVQAAALYARISSDQEGSGLGVARQLEDCRRLADLLGWPVVEEYVDNDLSAYSGKRHPAYERMLTDLRDGVRDAVVVYHVDRLTGRPIELEQFVTTVDAAKVRHVRFVVGDLDLGSGDGLMVVRMLAAIAAHESQTKSRGVRRKLEQVRRRVARTAGRTARSATTTTASRSGTTRPRSSGSWPLGSSPGSRCARSLRGWTRKASRPSRVGCGGRRRCGRCSARHASPGCANTKG